MIERAHSPMRFTALIAAASLLLPLPLAAAVCGSAPAPRCPMASAQPCHPVLGGGAAPHGELQLPPPPCCTVSPAGLPGAPPATPTAMPELGPPPAALLAVAGTAAPGWARQAPPPAATGHSPPLYTLHAALLI